MNQINLSIPVAFAPPTIRQHIKLSDINIEQRIDGEIFETTLEEFIINIQDEISKLKTLVEAR